MFVDRLDIELKLTIAGQTTTVVAGDVKRFWLDMKPWGFTGEAEWWIVSESTTPEDELFEGFVGEDLVEVALTLKRSYAHGDEQAQPTTVKGIGIERRVVEQTVQQVANAPVLQRRYVLRFGDRAHVLWREHRPIALYVDKTFKKLVDDNVPSGVTVSCKWPVAELKHPVLTLGLGCSADGASFHDFVHWLLYTRCAGLYYDCAADSYEIVGEKPVAESTVSLRREQVASVQVSFPPTNRATSRVLNAHADAPTKSKEIANASSTSGVRRDFLMRSPLATDLDERVALETLRAKQHAAEVRVTLSTYPAVALRPSMKPSFGEDWSTSLFQNGKAFRVIGTHIDAAAEAPGPDDETKEPTNRYRIEYTVELEEESDPVFRHPEFVSPEWPFYVEGKVLSETGANDEGTYQVYKSDETSLDLYRVKVPLWDDAKVIVSYEPLYTSGHFYFPIDKDARVLLSLDFEGASICGFLDWRAGARLPLDSQGNHLLVGKKAKSQTSIKHVYEDAKPVFSIVRSSDTDLQVLKVSDGTILLQTKDDE